MPRRSLIDRLAQINLDNHAQDASSYTTPPVATIAFDEMRENIFSPLSTSGWSLWNPPPPPVHVAHMTECECPVHGPIYSVEVALTQAIPNQKPFTWKSPPLCMQCLVDALLGEEHNIIDRATIKESADGG